LRSRVTLSEADLLVFAAWDGDPGIAGPEVAGIVARDPRLPEAGWRVLSAAPVAVNATEEDWDLHRLALGLPDGSRDMEAEKSILLEAGFDELHGVSWTKGCYMGQELTARTKYRGLVKRRLVPVRIDGDTPPAGAPILWEGREVGTMRSSAGRQGMAVVRLEALENVLQCEAARITPAPPKWMRMGDDG